MKKNINYQKQSSPCNRCGGTGKVELTIDGRPSYLKCACQGEIEPYRCQTCRDTFIITTMKNGREVGAKCPDCQARDVEERVRKHLPGNPVSWGDFNSKLNDISSQLKSLQSFWKSNFRACVIWGPKGTGKTMALKALYYDAAKRLIPVFYTTAQKVKDELHHMYTRPELEDINFFPAIERSRLLLIDDMNAETDTLSGRFESWMSEIFNLYPGKVVITSNRNPWEAGGEFEMSYDTRLLSRLCENSMIIAFLGEDYRILKGEKNAG